MVTGTIPLNKLVTYSLVVDAVNENGDWFIYYYTPEGKTQYKIKLDAASLALLKQKRDQMITFLNQEVTLSGDIVETWKLQPVTYPGRTVDEWVLQ